MRGVVPCHPSLALALRRDPTSRRPVVHRHHLVMLQVLAVIVGVLAVASVLASAIRTVILPRSAQSLLTAVVFRIIGAIFYTAANPRLGYERRDSIMALYGPTSLLALVAAWLMATRFGFTLLFWAAGVGSLGDAFHLSGSSITTLGFAPASTLTTRALAFVEAGLGLVLVALLITYLPSMYAAFSTRETRLTLLEVRAGSPPSAVELLNRHARIGWLDRLDQEWILWEEWFAVLEESHTTSAILPFFRSPQPDRSWVTGAGTVLDAAALHHSTIDVDPSPQAAVLIRGGFIALRRIADFFGIRHDPEPAVDDPISITRAEFDAACDAMAEAGIPIRDDRDQAWRDFVGWRVNYDTVLRILAGLTLAPSAPWSGDRAIGVKIRPFRQIKLD